MSHQYFFSLGNLTVRLISQGASCSIINRAEHLIARIIAKDIARGMQPKVLKGNKRWMSYRINRQYRLLVMRTNMTGPYYCLSHNDYDHWVNRK